MTSEGRNDDWDAIVVGAGPAGSVTSMLLAGRGRRVLLLDRAAFPRRKACGESINPGAVGELAELGLLDDVLELPHGRVQGWSIRSAGGRAFRGRFPRGAFGLTVDRGLFDGLLLERAAGRGAVVRTGVAVAAPWLEGGRVVGVELQDRARIGAGLVVGADGLRSVLVRRLGLIRRPPRLRKVGLTAHVAGAVVPPDAGELHVTSWGCVGVVEIAPDVANVVVVLNDGESWRLGGGAAGAFDAALAAIPALADARRSSDVLATGPFDWPTRAITADGALLVGDAAGYYDPFTGQGIYRALRGARLAAAAADRALVDGAGSRHVLAAYATAHRRAFAAGARLQRVVEAAVSRPRLFSVIAAALGAAPSLADRLVTVAGDLRPVRSLLLPSPDTPPPHTRAPAAVAPTAAVRPP